MKFLLEIDLPDDDFLKDDNRKVVSDALTIVARDLSYDRIYKRFLTVGRQAEISILDQFTQLEKVGKWEVTA